MQDLQDRIDLYRSLLQGTSISVSVNSSVEDVFAQHGIKILGSEPQPGSLAIRQAGVLVNHHEWSTLQYHSHPKLGTITVRARAADRGGAIHSTPRSDESRASLPLR